MLKLWRATLKYAVTRAERISQTVSVSADTKMDRRRSTHGSSSSLKFTTKNITHNKSFLAFNAENDVRTPQWSIPSTEGLIDPEFSCMDDYTESDDDDDVFAFTESKLCY